MFWNRNINWCISFQAVCKTIIFKKWSFPWVHTFGLMCKHFQFMWNDLVGTFSRNTFPFPSPIFHFLILTLIPIPVFPFPHFRFHSQLFISPYRLSFHFNIAIPSFHFHLHCLSSFAFPITLHLDSHHISLSFPCIFPLQFVTLLLFHYHYHYCISAPYSALLGVGLVLPT